MWMSVGIRIPLWGGGGMEEGEYTTTMRERRMERVVKHPYGSHKEGAEPYVGDAHFPDGYHTPIPSAEAGAGTEGRQGRQDVPYARPAPSTRDSYTNTNTRSYPPSSNIPRLTSLTPQQTPSHPALSLPQTTQTTTHASRAATLPMSFRTGFFWSYRVG